MEGAMVSLFLIYSYSRTRSCGRNKIRSRGAEVRVQVGRLASVSSPAGVKLATVPCAGVCGVPIVAGPLAAAGPAAALAVDVLHGLLWVIAPLNLLLLWFNYRRHRDARPLMLGTLGVIFIVAVMALHAAHETVGLESWPHNPLIWTGLALLASGSLLDWRAGRRGVSRTAHVSLD